MSIFTVNDPQVDDVLDFGSVIPRTIEVTGNYPVPCWLRFNDGPDLKIEELPFRTVRRCSSVQVRVDITPPAVPAGLTAITASITTDTVPFNFTTHPNTDGDLQQLVFVLDTTGTSTPADVVPGQSLPAVVTVDVATATSPTPSAQFVGTFSPGTLKIRGFAQDTHGNDSAYTAAVNAVVPTPTPPAPTAIVLTGTTPLSPTQNRVAYTVAALDHDSLQLHRSLSSGFTPSAATLIVDIGKATSIGAKLVDDITAPSGQLVYYKVRAINNQGTGISDSNQLSCQTQSSVGAASPYYSDTFGATRQDGSSTEFKWGLNGSGAYPAGGVFFSNEIARTGTHSLNFRTFREAPCWQGSISQGGNQWFRLHSVGLPRVWLEWYLYLADGTEVIRTLTNCSVQAGSNVLTVPGGGLVATNSSTVHDDGRKAIIPGAGPGGSDLTVRIQVLSSTTAAMYAPTPESGALVLNAIGNADVPLNSSATLSGLSVPLKLWRYYHRVPKSYVSASACGNYNAGTNCKFLALYFNTYSQPSVILERRAHYDSNFTNHVGDSYLYADWIAPPNTSPNDPRVISTGSPVLTDATRGRWNLFQYEVKLPTTNASADGVQRLLINGVLVASIFNYSSDYCTSTGQLIRKGYFYGVQNPGVNERQDLYMDDLKAYSADPGW